MRIKRIFICGAVFILTAGLATGVRAAETIKPMSLPESIDLALKQSVILHAAKEGIRGAEAQRKEAFTGFLPKFSTSYSYTRLNEDPSVISPGSSLVLPPPIGSVTVPPSTHQAGTKDNYNWTIEARQPLFAGGAIRANYEASRLGAEIARHEDAAVRTLSGGQGLYFDIEGGGSRGGEAVRRRLSPPGYGPGFLRRRYNPRNDLLRG